MIAFMVLAPNQVSIQRDSGFIVCTVAILYKIMERLDNQGLPLHEDIINGLMQLVKLI